MKTIGRVFLSCVLVNALFFGFVTDFNTVHANSSVAQLPAPELVSVTYNDYSYDVPASTSKDPFTGKTIEHPAYHIDNRTLTFTINKKNISTDHGGYFYYLIRMKGAFSNEWNTITSKITLDHTSPLTTVVLALPSPETILTSNPGQNYYYYPLEGKADFQVQAQEWRQVPTELGPPFESSHVETLRAESDWSNTKTVTFGQYSDNGNTNQPTPSPSQTSSLDQTESQKGTNLSERNLSELVLTATLGTIIVTLTIAFVYKRNKTKSQTILVS
ncbi:MAG: hypothetical protein FWD52_03800 [Candidatus Bathyarchaeota archaeon]|nr:hypothetical protein [Candidatus Termiticorpusculum sp.]